MLTLTPAATETIRRVIAGSDGQARGLRIQVTGGGCSGYQYAMGLEAGPGDGDAVIEADGIQVYVDAESGPLLAGVTVDYVEGLQGAGFKFENPNATKSCGCGSSFSCG